MFDNLSFNKGYQKNYKKSLSEDGCSSFYYFLCVLNNFFVIIMIIIFDVCVATDLLVFKDFT